MRVLSLITTLLFAVAAVSVQAAEPDGKKIQGVWKPIAMQANGVFMGRAIVEMGKFTFQDDKFQSNLIASKERDVTFTLDANVTPHALDIHCNSGPHKGTVLHGIYEFEKDMLKLCFPTTASGARPAEFTAKPGSGQSLLLLKRAKS